MKLKTFLLKKVIVGCSVFLLGTGLISLTAQAETITEQDYLKADGVNLKREKGTGDIVNLRGTNIGGWLLQELWMTPTKSTAGIADEEDIYRVLSERFGSEKMYELVNIYQNAYFTEQDFENLEAIGVNCLRLPFWFRNFMDEKGDFYGYDVAAKDPYAQAFEKLDWFIEQAGNHGMYVILDCHGAPGSQNGSDHSGIDGGETKEASSRFFFGEEAVQNQEIYYKMWEVIAARYEGNPIVAGYDVLNEPFCTYRYNASISEDEMHTMLWQIYDTVYQKIRGVDADHVVIMEATWDPVDLPEPADYGWQNVMYEYHNYLYDDYDNVQGKQIDNMVTKLKKIANANYNVPSLLGEFNYFNNKEAWQEGMQLLTLSGINWTTWTYKTVADYGNWGLYHHPANISKIDLEKATEDQIREYYSHMGESSINQDMVDIVSQYCKYETVENQLKPGYLPNKTEQKQETQEQETQEQETENQQVVQEERNYGGVVVGSILVLFLLVGGGILLLKAKNKRKQ